MNCGFMHGGESTISIHLMFEFERLSFTLYFNNHEFGLILEDMYDENVIANLK